MILSSNIVMKSKKYVVEKQLLRQKSENGQSFHASPMDCINSSLNSDIQRANTEESINSVVQQC